MRAEAKRFLKFMKDSDQFCVPIYQRTYSWTDRQCQQLWDDILRIGKDPNTDSHFVGSVVYIQDGVHSVSTQPFLLIDGQQRLTTITLILEALSRAVGDEEPVPGFSSLKIGDYLLNEKETGEDRYKLLLTQTDEATLKSLLDQQEAPREPSIQLMKNFEWIENEIEELEGDLTALCSGLQKLMLVDISLDRNQDNAQLIFESMNSTGRELSQADLIRNFVLMRLPAEEQEKLYNNKWRRMELDFGQENFNTQFDKFVRDFLTVKTREIPKIKDVYEEFKKYSLPFLSQENGVESLLDELGAFASIYCSMALGQEQEPELQAPFEDFKELKADVAYPFLLEVYKDYQDGCIPLEDFVNILRLVESYVFRRAICGIPTNSMNKTFGMLGKEIDKDQYLESVEVAFLLLTSYRRFPDDDEFKRLIVDKDLYGFARRNYWLRRIENYKRKELVVLDEYTIEHIMPQNENVSSAWREELGPEWKRIHKEKLHTLGNLTLTRYNSEYSDHPFSKKRDMENGLGKSPLVLNEGFGEVTQWDESAINSRADRLSDLAMDIWASPSHSEETLAKYRPVKEAVISDYSLADHKALREETIGRILFYELRTEILSLDPSIEEVPLKYYIAYKAETNVVDVIPFRNHVSLTINLFFDELVNKDQRTRDISKIGSWGNGEVEIRISSSEDIPHAIGVIRQSLEKQIEVHDDRPSEMGRSGDGFKEETSERHLARSLFWSSLLERAGLEERANEGQNYSNYQKVSTSKGVEISYGINKFNSSVYCYIDKGQTHENWNQTFYEYLLEHKEDIEEVYGGPLSWNERQQKTRSRLTQGEIELGGWNDPDMWEQMIETMIAKMEKFQEALNPFLDEARRRADKTLDSSD